MFYTPLSKSTHHEYVICTHLFNTVKPNPHSFFSDFIWFHVFFTVSHVCILLLGLQGRKDPDGLFALAIPVVGAPILWLFANPFHFLPIRQGPSLKAQSAITITDFRPSKCIRLECHCAPSQAMCRIIRSKSCHCQIPSMYNFGLWSILRGKKMSWQFSAYSTTPGWNGAV